MIRKLQAQTLRKYSTIKQVDRRPENGFPKITSSYCHNAGTSTLISDPFDQVLLQTAARIPDSLACTFHTEKFSSNWQDIVESSGKFADGLLKLGLQPGDKVAMWGPSIKEWMITHYALARAGLVLVTVNPLYTTAELEYVCEKADVKAIVAPPSMLNLQPYLQRISELKNPPKYQIMVNNNMVMNGGKVIDTTHEIFKNTLDFDDILNTGDSNSTALKNVHNDMDDLHMIQFTSGTTGKPKAAGLTHHNVVNNAQHIAMRTGLTEGTKILVNVPLFHCFGNVGGNILGGFQGTHSIFPHPGWNALASIDAINEYDVTNMYGTPTMFIDMFTTVDRQPELQEKMKSLKYGHVGASLMPAEYVKRANEQFGIQTQVMYGTTENSPYVSGCYLNDPYEKQAHTIGRPGDHIECKIVNSEGEIVPVGESGELCTRGYQVFMGYLGDEEKTREAIDSSRWYFTGDTASMDGEGYISIVGRSKDMINRGGENVYPSEIEAVLLQHENVMDAQVVGAEDSRLGEVVAVYLKVKNDEGDASIKELKDHCEAQLSAFKVPKHWKIVEAYPQTLSGKVMKYVLREQAKTDFELRL